MEVFKRRTKAILTRFLHDGISFPSCIAALDAAFADLIPRLKSGQIPELRALTLANNAIVMKEMERRRLSPSPTTVPF